MSKAQRLKAARRERRQLPDKAAIRPASSRTGAAASWLGYPVVYLLLTISVADAITLADPDLWGHIRFGQAMLDAGHLFRYDPYSYSAPAHLWRNHEWLSEVALALFYNALGVFGLELLKLICSAATLLFVSLAVGESRAPPLVQSAVVMLTAPAFAPFMQFRPQLFSFALTAALMWLLARYTYRGSAPLWLAIPILALWANFHGGYIAGLGALGTYAAIVSIQGVLERRDWRGAARWSLIVVASLLATLINPYGIGAWYAVGHALANPLTRQVVGDWQPISLVLAREWRLHFRGALLPSYALGFLLALGVAVALGPRSRDRPLVILATIFTAGALISVRNVPLAVIVTSIPLAHHLDLAWRQRSANGLDTSAARQRAAPPATGPALPKQTSQPLAVRVEHSEPGPSEASQRDYLGPLFAGTAALLLLLNGLFSSSLEAQMPCPGGAVAFMKQHHLRGNLLSIYGWGEYLIWHMSPDSKVFMDGRYDTVYPPEVIRDYFHFEHAAPEAKRVLHAYKHDFVLVPLESAPWRVVSEDKAWKLLYRDEIVALFGHADLVLDGVTTPVVWSAPPSVFP